MAAKIVNRFYPLKQCDVIKKCWMLMGLQRCYSGLMNGNTKLVQAYLLERWRPWGKNIKGSSRSVTALFCENVVNNDFL